MYGPREVDLSPVAAPALCSLAEVKAALNITGAAQDAQLTGLIASASAALETYCGQPLGERTVTERRIAMDTADAVILSYAPASELSAVSVKGVAQSLAEFRLSSRFGTIRHVEGACFEPGEWVFEYSTGYASGAVPEDLKSAAILYAKHLYNSIAGNVVSESIAKESTPDVGSVEYRTASDRSLTRNGAALPADIGLMLSSYVKEF